MEGLYKDALERERKAKRNAYEKKYREENKDKIKIGQKKWHENNKEHLKKYAKEWRYKNKDKWRVYSKKHYQKNMNKIRADHNEYRKISSQALTKVFIRGIIKGRNQNPDNYTPEMLDIVRTQILIHRHIKTTS